MLTQQIHIADYNYSLPDERIAKFPLAERDSSKLLIYNKGVVSEDVFTSLPKYIPTGSLMVFNNTKVIQARLHFRKDPPLPPIDPLCPSDISPSMGRACQMDLPSHRGGGMGRGSIGSGLPLGALIEVFCLEPALPNDYQLNFSQKGSVQWYCLVGNLKKWKGGALHRKIDINGETITLSCERKGLHGTSHTIEFTWDGNYTWAELLDAVGELPIPPYLNRETQESDKRTYQTVYSKIKGSVAAPTAGLHFTERVLSALDAAGIDREELTLHVGAGTFKPVKSEEIGGHDMHTEHIAVRRQTIEKLIAHGGKATAVGTTSVRTLESLYYMGLQTTSTSTKMESVFHVPQWMPYETEDIPTLQALWQLLDYMNSHQLDVLHGSTQIIIAPGYHYHIVERMVTNFHQPQSTLLLLVSAFVNGDWHKIYDYALAHDFRFLSYGDSSLLIP
jgi:S-adenosylmethionine:tRNA ribosyltransferase-isomerase